MKTTLTLIISVLIAGSSFGQEIKNNMLKKNSIWVEVYTPITTNGLRHLFNENWILSPSIYFDGDILRKYTSISVGLNYERLVSDDLVLRSRLGISSREVYEENYYSGGFNENEVSILDEDFQYKQSHLNIFLGLARKVNLTNKLSIDIGIELPFIVYLDSKSQYSLNLENKEIGTSEFDSNVESTVNTSYGKAYLCGAGPIAKLEYGLSNSVCISIEAQFYFLHTYVNDSVIKQESYKENSAWEQEEIFIESNVKTDFKLSQWSWSKITPLFRIGYKF